MNWLFVHRNFPGQYLHIARHLAATGERVTAIGQPDSAELSGVRRLEYRPPPAARPVDEDNSELAAAISNGRAVARLCRQLAGEGFVPDIVIGHNGWGETLFVKDVWPDTPLLNYFEFFYRATGSDVGFDPEFAPDPEIAWRLRTRNAVNLMGLDAADWGQTATLWQRAQYPRRWWDRISVLHEGIDTALVRPDPAARLWLRGGLSLGGDDEILTYSARNLEPYRGFHVFVRALPQIMRRRPQARVLIVGGDGTSYGNPPAGTVNWRQQLLDEVGGELDMRRIHFLGRLGFRQYLAVLQISAAHVYLSYPFVLSWSLLEALAAQCAVVASRTPPVEEIVTDGENGYLVDFFDRDGLVERVVDLLGARAAQHRIRAAARDSVVTRYDLAAICLPAHLALLAQLTGRPVPGTSAR